ncbi:hypothetical protein [Salinibacterium sp. ZJ454]|uniref:GAF domain-containing protein n=1 Tax=Salinibacterium sp. ZJ454 TaxID=2708339 RepID=UPI00142110B2|nr:hypothetical protein [Salinibacterium sp. ZJ454]
MSTVQRVASAVVWLWRLTKGWLPQTLATAATIISIVWGSYGEKIWAEGLWALITAVALALASLVAQALLQRPSYMELAKLRAAAEDESKEKSQAIEQSITVLLRKLAEHCRMAANSDRASVYFFHDERFIMLARWSTHPTYTKPGRRDYPTGQGAIGEAWDRGSVVATLPSSRWRWDQRLEKHHGFPPGMPATLSMHSQSIAALRIDTNHHAVGVLVFESTDPDRASQDTLDTASVSMLYATLSELVGAIAALTPRVEEVAKNSAESQTSAPPKWKQVAPVT